jgi:hypothetical protein
MASQHEKAFCMLHFEVSRSVITVHMRFVHGLEKLLFFRGASFLSRARNSHFTVIADPDTLKRNSQKSFSCCNAILDSGLAAPQKALKRAIGSAWETKTVPAADSLCCVRESWKINSLTTFETAPFFYVCPVCICVCVSQQYLSCRGILLYSTALRRALDPFEVSWFSTPLVVNLGNAYLR